MASTFGTIFRVSTFGESHGGGVGVVIDGCPPRLPLTVDDLQFDLDRRRPGQSHLVTQRDEADQAEILSGIFEGFTTGTPIAVLVRNKDHNSGAYDHLKDVYRPSHADFTYDAKYGFRDWAGGGRASARETIGRVAAAAVARKLLAEEKYHLMHGRSWLVRLGSADDESHERMQTALTAAMPHALGMFEPTPHSQALADAGVCPSEDELQRQWLATIETDIAQAGLKHKPLPEPHYGGRSGKCGDELVKLLDDMQKVFRLDPAARDRKSVV